MGRWIEVGRNARFRFDEPIIVNEIAYRKAPERVHPRIEQVKNLYDRAVPHPLTGELCFRYGERTGEIKQPSDRDPKIAHLRGWFRVGGDNELVACPDPEKVVLDEETKRRKAEEERKRAEAKRAQLDKARAVAAQARMRKAAAAKKG